MIKQKIVFFIFISFIDIANKIDSRESKSSQANINVVNRCILITKRLRNYSCVFSSRIPKFGKLLFSVLSYTCQSVQTEY